jgi:hypothetical protein
VPASLHINSRFNGPQGSGNGGYSAGVVAGLLGGEAEVSLRRPVPLDTELEVRNGNGEVRVLVGEELVIEGRRAKVAVEPPAAVSLDEARRASQHYRGLPDGLFCNCFVCGRARAKEDCFEVFAGAVDGRGLVASAWTPPPWAGDSTGNVLPEFVWATLDCPTYFATYMEEDLAVSFLARFTARVGAEIPVGEEHVVVAWPIETDGRKRYAGSAVLSAEGETRAVASALLIEPRPR